MKNPNGVVVAILTFRRESELAVCIDSVRASIQASGASAQVVVGDNDPESTTPTYVADGIERLHLGFGGVSPARRALVDLARARDRRYIVFVDDDEYEGSDDYAGVDDIPTPAPTHGRPSREMAAVGSQAPPTTFVVIAREPA